VIQRAAGVAIVLFWAASMSWLVWHDVWPVLSAGEPPKASACPEAGRSEYQVGLLNKYGHRLGTIWSTYEVVSTQPERTDVIHLHGFPILPSALIEIQSRFTRDGELDEFDLELTGLEQPIKVHGERFASVYGFSAQVGLWHETFKVNAADAGLIGAVFQPFASLPGLHVGQTWRMQVVNPLALVTGFGPEFTPIVVKVTERQTMTTTDGREVDCLVVEAPGVRAWVQDNGLVVRQEVELPVGGTIVLRDEPYDEEALRHARARFAANEESSSSE